MSASNLDKLHAFSGRPSWAEMNLNNLAANFSSIKKRVGAERRIMAIVKANAYGHGAVDCARRLAREGADWFGVALPEEGIQLRESGIVQPILSLGGLFDTPPRAHCSTHPPR